MVWLLAAAWSVAVVLPAAADRATQIHTIEVGGLARTYLLHVPPSLPAGPVPLVLVFHGGGGNGIGTERLTRFSELADREGLLVAYRKASGGTGTTGASSPPARAPTASGSTTSASWPRRSTRSRGRTRWTRADLRHRHLQRRGLLHYLAAHLSPRIAAIAPVVGGIADPPTPGCDPSGRSPCSSCRGRRTRWCRTGAAPSPSDAAGSSTPRRRRAAGPGSTGPRPSPARRCSPRPARTTAAGSGSPTRAAATAARWCWCGSTAAATPGPAAPSTAGGAHRPRLPRLQRHVDHLEFFRAHPKP